MLTHSPGLLRLWVPKQIGEKYMAKHRHEFVEMYDGLVGYGLDRKTDEDTIIVYLQKFSDDDFMELIRSRLTDQELKEIFELITRILHSKLTEKEYHKYFLK